MLSAQTHVGSHIPLEKESLGMTSAEMGNGPFSLTCSGRFSLYHWEYYFWKCLFQNEFRLQQDLL